MLLWKPVFLPYKEENDVVIFFKVFDHDIAESIPDIITVGFFIFIIPDMKPGIFFEEPRGF